MNHKITKAKQIIQIQGMKMFMQRLREHYISSDHDDSLKKLIIELSDDYPVFIDIGAKIGDITKDVAQYFDKCICFEPFTENYRQIKKMIKEKNFINVITFNCALSDENGIGKLFLSPYSPGENRLNKTSDENWNYEQVNIRSLDDVLNELGIDEKCLIKIDAEGSELSIMRGASTTLEKDSVVISEFFPWCLVINKTEPSDYLDFMKSKEFRIYDLNGKPITENYLSRMCNNAKKFKYVMDNFLFKK